MTKGLHVAMSFRNFEAFIAVQLAGQLVVTHE